jgi:wyosine [tRNA(Phe)-imidazoG37] synthetase (radical SAM superfamily)
MKEITTAHVFGPVSSRRLGKSLGIDPIPLKTCNWNCVYCQLGRSRPMVNERKEYVPSDQILEQARQALGRLGPEQLDWVTFVGSGETTLHSELGALIQGIQSLTEVPVAVITNGALLRNPEVRRDVSIADAVLPALDAGSPTLYQRINRPHPHVPFPAYSEGLIQLGQEYGGELWLEVMMLEGLNDNQAALIDLRELIDRIQPQKVHLAVPYRPPAEAWVKPASEEGLMRARAILGTVTEVLHPRDSTLTTPDGQDLSDAILGVITRHPMRIAELEHMFQGQTKEGVEGILISLFRSGRAKSVERLGVQFWVAADAYFPK